MPDAPLLLDLTAPRLGSGFDAGRYLLVVALVIGTLACIAWGARRMVAGAWRARAARRSLGVVDVLPLGGRRQLTVVRCYDRTFLLGVGEKEVSLVAELDPDGVGPAPADEPRGDASRAAVSRAGASPAGVPGEGPEAATRRFQRLVERARRQLDARLRRGRPAQDAGREEELVA